MQKRNERKQSTPRWNNSAALIHFLALCLLFVFPFCFSACFNNSEAIEKTKISLTESNIFDYISFNVNYSDYSIYYIDDTYLIICKVEFSTSPRIPDIEFESVTIKYNPSHLAITFSLRNSADVASQLDNNGYSTTSFYCYKETSGFYPATSFPADLITVSDISSVEGNVIITE